MSRGKPALRIPHDAYVFVGDGRKALLLRNEGDAQHPNLKTEQVFEHDNPPTREQGTDKPGRSYASVGGRRSAMEQADWHELEEQRFAKDVADTPADAGARESIEAAGDRRTAEDPRRAAQVDAPGSREARHRRGRQGPHQPARARDREAADGGVSRHSGRPKRVESIRCSRQATTCASCLY